MSYISVPCRDVVHTGISVLNVPGAREAHQHELKLHPVLPDDAICLDQSATIVWVTGRETDRENRIRKRCLEIDDRLGRLTLTHLVERADPATGTHHVRHTRSD